MDRKWTHHRMHAAIAAPQPARGYTQAQAKSSSRLFLLLGLGTLDLRRTTEGLLSVLALLACSCLSA